jgi:hypothetical protein
MIMFFIDSGIDMDTDIARTTARMEIDTVD